MTFKELMRANRSYRRFYENERISRDTLLALLDNARLSASGSNLQALKYFISCDAALNEKIFPSLSWAMYLKGQGTPPPGERPSAYVILLQDQGYKIAGGVDHGIAAQTILLGATEIGLGGCMFVNIKRDQLLETLGLPATYEILLAIALGKPKEKVVMDEIEPGGDIKYWRDKDQVHHVPKRKLKDIIIN
jgi:nitroreductase